MKKNKIFSIAILFLATTFFGCKKNKIADNEASFSKIVDLSLHENLTNELGIYTGQFVLHNGNVNIRSTIVDGSPSGRITGWHIEDKELGNRINGGDYFINGMKLKYNGGGYQVDPFLQESQHDFINNFISNEVIGKEISIKNEENGQLIFDKSFYVPKDLYLTGNIENKIDGSIFRKMNKNNFTFGYNQDDKNENGILILLDYSGEFYGMSLDDLANITSANNLKRVIHLKQEIPGEITLPNKFFDGIPSNGIVTLVIGRGNGKLFQLDGKEYYVRAFTTQQLRVVIE